MDETEIHDLSDDADYAASIEQGSARIMRSDSSSIRSPCSEPEGAEIVYLKDNVTIHPTQYVSERIGGRLKLIKQGSSLFMYGSIISFMVDVDTLQRAKLKCKDVREREFDYERTLRLWEVLWTHHLREHLHLYVCVAILKRYRVKIMGEQMDFDTLLKFINELSGHIDLDAVLQEAEALCVCAGEKGAASIPPGTPPSLPIDNGSLYNQDEDEILSTWLPPYLEERT